MRRTVLVSCALVWLGAACDSPTGPGRYPSQVAGVGRALGLVFSADIDASGQVLVARLFVYNPGTEPVSFHLGGCPVDVYLYRRHGAVIPMQQAQRNCPDIVKSQTVTPGDQVTVAVRSLADAPDGAFRVTMINLRIMESEVDAGTHSFR